MSGCLCMLEEATRRALVISRGNDMRFLRLIALGTLVCVTACGGGGGGSSGSSPGPSTTYSAEGGVAEKGPLVQGSTVTAQELSATLSPTGKQYTYQITSDLGNFSPTANFGSQYIGLFASGYYFDEVQNAVSTGTITLNGYSDLAADKVLNLNLLTTLTFQRIQNLVTQQGMTFTAARNEAETEVLAALNIPAGNYGSFSTLDFRGGTNGDNILAAVSSIFVYGHPAGSLSQLVSDFQSDIGANGVITNPATKAALTVASQAVNPLQVAANLTTKYSSDGVTFTASALADWIDQNGIGIVGRFTFQVTHATSASSFTLPSYVSAQFAGTSIAVTGGLLSVNGIPATAPVTIGASDVLTLSPGTAAFQQGILITYLTSAGKNAAAVIFIQGGPMFALAANNANTGPGSVSVYAVQPVTGVFQPVAGSPFPAGLQPTSITVDPTGRFAYVPNSNSNNISAFVINPTTGALSTIAGSPFAAGTEPISVGITPSGNFAYAANLGAGTVSGYSVDQATGVLTALSGSPFAVATQPYCITIEPTGRFAYFPDEFSGQVSGYSIDATTGALTVIAGSPVTAGSNPYCVTVNHSGTFAYVPNAGGSDSVFGFSINPTSGVLTPTAGSPYPVGTNFGPVSVAITPDGAFAYVANVLANSVSAFSIDSATGALTSLAGGPYSTGTTPNSISIDPTGRFLYAVNVRDNTVSGFSINAATGALTPLPGSPYPTGPFPYSVAVTQVQ